MEDLKGHLNSLIGYLDILKKECIFVKNKLETLQRTYGNGSDDTLCGIKNNSFDESTEDKCVARSKRYPAKIYSVKDEGVRQFIEIPSLTHVVILCEADGRWYLILMTDYMNFDGFKFQLDDQKVKVKSVNMKGQEMVLVEDDTNRFCVNLKDISVAEFLEKINNVKGSFSFISLM
uniref:Tudor domain-containing protein n=1 Tax=Strongyloides papillosus TaxID=174720 RepID=A0A0N5CFM7_STREA